MRPGWAAVSLGEVCRISGDVVHPAALPPNTPYIGLEHIEKGGRLIGSSSIGAAKVTSAKVRFTPSHVLFGKLRPNLSKITTAEVAGVASTDILPLLPSDLIDKRFLLHHLRRQVVTDEVTRRATGANLPRISPKALATIEIPLPPLDEQRRIAAVLDHVDDLRRARQAVVEEVDRLRTAVIQIALAALDVAPCELQDVAVVSSGITKGRKAPSGPLVETPYLAVSNVQDGWLALSSVKTIAVSASEVERFALHSGDIVLTEGGDPDKLGRGTLWREELPTAIHQNHIFRVRSRGPEQTLPDYLALALRSAEARSHFLRSAKQTTGIATINMTQLKRTPVRIPDLERQREVVRRVVGIDAVQATAKRHLGELDALFASLQARTFAGELDLSKVILPT